MYIDRQYIKNTILSISQENNIIEATKKLEKIYGVPWYTLYNFTRNSIPTEKNLLKIIKCLNIDANKLFVVT